jgi:hypothetical protein
MTSIEKVATRIDIKFMKVSYVDNVQQLLGNYIRSFVGSTDQELTL